MKKNIYIAVALAGMLMMNSCKDDDLLPGNPVMDFNTEYSDALFGDSLSFSIKASDVDVPLSTLKAQLYFGGEKVSETVIRTKTSGQDYSGKIYIPYLANIPNGKATLKYILQNINFTTSEKEVELSLRRPDFPYLTLVTADEEEYKMERTDLNQYSVTGRFSNEVKGYILAPKVGENGNEITFGWTGKEIMQGTMSAITFSNATAGNYSIAFNTLTYVGSPFMNLTVNGEKMELADSESFRIDLNLTKGQKLSFEGVPDYDNWWIDPDFFKKDDEGKLEFLPISGNYRVIANMKHKAFMVQTLSGGKLATLQPDGTGAIWLIGNGIGKPSVAAKEVGWTPENALCMSQMAPKKYQITLVAGRSIKSDNIDFKFFYAAGWDGEFKSDALSSTSNLIGVGTGKVDNVGYDSGNLYIKEGKTLAPGHIYKLVVDVTAGIDKAVLSVTDDGEQTIEVKNITIGGTKMNSVDGELYTATLDLTQNQSVAVTGISGLNEWWINPDYFTLEDGALKFLPLAGTYRITANTSARHIAVTRMNGNVDATLGADGHGAVWMMGWGVGSPSLDVQLGWNPGAAYCLPEVAPKIYRFTATAGPEKGSLLGDRIRFDYLSCKFFFQNGWGGELSGDNALTIAAGSEAFIAQPGNIEFAADVKLEVGTTYVITVDLTAGNNKGVVSFEKE